MNFNINNLLTSSQLVESQILCYNWTISLQYEFIAMSHIVATLNAQPTYCTTPNNQSQESFGTFIKDHKEHKSALRSLSVYFAYLQCFLI